MSWLWTLSSSWPLVTVSPRRASISTIRPEASEMTGILRETSALTVPVVFKDHTAFMSTDFINQVFQSGLDKTFVVETRPNPLNPLSAAEITTAVDIVKKSENYKPGFRFTEVSVKEPPKDQVWNFALTGQNVAQPRQASIVVLDGKHVVEALVDLDSKQLTSWKPIEGAHGIEPRQEDHRRSGQEHHVGRHEQAVGVEDRQGVDEHVLAREAPALDQGLGVGPEVGVGEHRALGPSGRARRVEDGGEVVVGADDVGVLGGLGRRGVEERAAGVSTQRLDVAHTGGLGRHRERV